MARSFGRRGRQHCGEHRRHLETLAGRASTSRAHEGAKSFPSGGGMERMTKNSDYETKLWKVLEKNQLADLSQFHRPHFFEEVPIYSRYSDISFLQECRPTEANKVLL